MEIQSSRDLKTEFDGSIVRLVMENVEVSDTDSYKCIAENDVGIDQIKAKVTIHREIIKRTGGKQFCLDSYNHIGSIYGRSSIKIAHFVSIRKQTWPPQAILVSDWLISKKSSSLKLLGQMNRNLVGSILGRSSIKIAQFVLIH
jgi:hypothetical protein